MSSIQDFKTKQSALMAKIQKKIKKDESGGSRQDDERLWSPTFNEEKGGSAVIRFLPDKNSDNIPFVKVIRYIFRNNGKWIYENSMRTFDKPCPIADLNYRLYNSGIESDKKQAKDQKQKPRWYANILVVKDPGNPENEGKVFIYEFGPAIWNLIEAELFPNEILDPDKQPRNPFNLFAAPNLHIKMMPKQLGKNIVPNYEKTQFSDTETEVENPEEIADQLYDITEFISPEKFKSTLEIQKQLISVLGYTTGSGIPTVEGVHADSDLESPETRSKAPEPTKASSSTMLTEEAPLDASETTSGDDDDDEVAKLRAMLDAV